MGPDATRPDEPDLLTPPEGPLPEYRDLPCLLVSSSSRLRRSRREIFSTGLCVTLPKLAWAFWFAAALARMSLYEPFLGGFVVVGAAGAGQGRAVEVAVAALGLGATADRALLL